LKRTVLLSFGSSDDTGAGRAGLYLARGFKLEGWRVVAISPKPLSGHPSVIERLEKEMVETSIIPSTAFLRAILTAWKYFTTTWAIKPTLVLTMHQTDIKFAAFACILTNTPLVVSGQNTLTFSGGPICKKTKSKTLGSILNYAAKLIIATSNRVSDEYRNKISYRGAIEVIPNGVDLKSVQNQTCDPKTIRRQLNISSESRMIIAVGRITLQKNQIYLIEQFAHALTVCPKEFSDINLVIVGDISAGTNIASDDAAYFKELKERVSQLGIGDRIRFTGWRADIPNLLAASDIYVQSSLWEGSPMAVLEAMAASLPVIIAENGSTLPGFESGQHGWIVDFKTQLGMGNAIATAVSKPIEELKSIGAAARKLVENNYDATIISRKTIKKINEHIQDYS
jgi:glycosyltransferase involved in cell wall biosynthesis